MCEITKMTSRLLPELEQESFEPNEFIERLAWRATSQNAGLSVGVSLSEEDFDSQALHDTFHQAIEELTLLQDRQKQKCKSLEQV